MTPEQEEAILSLALVPGGPRPMSSDEFLERFGVYDGKALGLDLLRDAVQRRDAVDVELAMIVGFRFGFSMKHLLLLVDLAYADWHQKHEDVVSALGMLEAPESIDALVHMTEWVPGYLAYDDTRALATKAVWALGAIDSDSARHALSELARAPDRIVAKGAEEQLLRRTQINRQHFTKPR
jgi:hypothetical protein